MVSDMSEASKSCSATLSTYFFRKIGYKTCAMCFWKYDLSTLEKLNIKHVLYVFENMTYLGGHIWYPHDNAKFWGQGLIKVSLRSAISFVLTDFLCNLFSFHLMCNKSIFKIDFFLIFVVDKWRSKNLTNCIRLN